MASVGVGINAPAGSNDKKRKRPRAARACEFCRAKKYRCDELYPCGQCRRQKVNCVYEGVEHLRDRLLTNYSGGAEQVQSGSHNPFSLGDAQQQVGQTVTQNVSPRTAGSAPALATPPRSHLSSKFPRVTLHDEHPPSRSTSYDQQNAGDSEVEVTDLNPHTQSVEFHGKTSSIAFLAALNPSVQSEAEQQATNRASGNQQTSLVSTFHNNAFSPDSLHPDSSYHGILDAEKYYFRQSRLFLEGHFQNIHFVHPILDKAEFMHRCEDLWFGQAAHQTKSFVALYYSVMSLGALVRTWDEGEKLDGLGRLEWSRKLFGLANLALRNTGLSTDIEMVQAQFFMAKVSQNELNPSLAYMHLGLATRICFSAGYNRASKQKDSKSSTSGKPDTITRTWWGLYSLEIEISFALGRPDSCGLDDFHNRALPPLDESEISIIPAMVTFARITRKVCTSIYLSDEAIGFKVEKALQIENEMESWALSLPSIIRPVLNQQHGISRITKEPLWAKRQKLVLGLRYFNVKMILFRPFLAQATETTRHSVPVFASIIDKCLEAARNTITQMHELYINQAFFRTWWYNTTYVLYAASIILCLATRVSPRVDVSGLLELGDKAVDILEAMDESVVARSASKMVNRIILQARERLSDNGDAVPDGTGVQPSIPLQNLNFSNNTNYPNVFEDGLHDMDVNLDFFDFSFPLDATQLSFWANSSLTSE